MPKLYTAKGDAGDTNLMGGRSKVPKDHLRVVALGEVDELNAAIGVAHSAVQDVGILHILEAVQDDLFTIGAEISAAAGKASAQKLPTIPRAAVTRLETAMERHDVGEIKEFILPRGPRGAAQLQLVRAVCRRAERAVVALSRQETVRPEVLAYMNRLSSLLFVLGVWVMRQGGVREGHPTYGGVKRSSRGRR